MYANFEQQSCKNEQQNNKADNIDQSHGLIAHIHGSATKKIALL